MVAARELWPQLSDSRTNIQINYTIHLLNKFYWQPTMYQAQF